MYRHLFIFLKKNIKHEITFSLMRTIPRFVQRCSSPDACVAIKRYKTQLRYLMKTTYLEVCVEVCCFKLCKHLVRADVSINLK